MDERQPSIPPSEFRLRFGSERISADIDPAPAELAEPDDLVAREQQSHFRAIELCRNDTCDGPSLAVYHGHEEEVREGFLVALTAMGLTGVEQARLPVRGGKAATTRVFSILAAKRFKIRFLD